MWSKESGNKKKNKKIYLLNFWEEQVKKEKEKNCAAWMHTENEKKKYLFCERWINNKKIQKGFSGG